MKHQTTIDLYFYTTMDNLYLAGDEQKMPPCTPVTILQHDGKNRLLVQTEQGLLASVWEECIEEIPAPTQPVIFTGASDLPLFTGQPVESSKYDARGYQPKEHYRQLDMWKETQA